MALSITDYQIVCRIFQKESSKELTAELNTWDSLVKSESRSSSISHQGLVVGGDRVCGEREKREEVVEGEAHGHQPGQPKPRLDFVGRHVAGHG